MSTGVTISSISDYAILGCGSVGYAVAEELVEQGKDVSIIDRDDSRVESLRDQDLDAKTADIRDAEIADLVADRDVVLILASNVESNKRAVEHIRESGADQFIVARASDPVSGDELSELGADIVINPSSVIAESALRALESGELEYNAGKLADLVEETATRLAIITQDSPDPDSIASAAALQAIATHLASNQTSSISAMSATRRTGRSSTCSASISFSGTRSRTTPSTTPSPWSITRPRARWNCRSTS